MFTKKYVESCIKSVIFRRYEIEISIRQQAERIVAATTLGKPLTVVAVLDGALPYAHSLMAMLPHLIRFNWISIRSYQGATESATGFDLRASNLDAVKDSQVVLLDDIYEKGKTFQCARDLVMAHKPASCYNAVLCWKPHKAYDTAPSIIGADSAITVPNLFVVGFGMDYNGFFRDLPFIGEMSDEGKELAKEFPNKG